MYNQAKNPGKVQKIIRIMYFIELLESNDSIYKIEIVLNFKKQMYVRGEINQECEYLHKI